MENLKLDADSIQIEEELKQIQNKICSFLIQTTSQHYIEDIWKYEKGSGGGISRVWESKDKEDMLEKAGVNWSGIVGLEIPETAATQLKIPPKTPYHATGVSLVIHPRNPLIPTIHMNVRYFKCGDVWWFGGGIDLTPYYTSKPQVIEFHKILQRVCIKWDHDYNAYKKECDSYFTIKHRNEMRGVSGIFFDHLQTSEKMKKSKEELWSFVKEVGNTFNELYAIFLKPELHARPYTPAQKEFQLIRRGRYVEFNLIYDRGTKFGLQSEGRIESILMSLPALASWKYNWTPTPGTPEYIMTTFFYAPQDWINLNVDPSDEMNQFGIISSSSVSKPTNSLVVVGITVILALVNLLFVSRK